MRAKLSGSVMLILLLGILARAIWSQFEIEAFYWIGNVILALFVAFPGLVVLLRPQLGYPWYYSALRRSMLLRTPRDIQPSSIERKLVLFFAILQILLGMFLIGITLYQLLVICSVADCPAQR